MTVIHSSFVAPEVHKDLYAAHLLRYELDDNNHCTKAEHFNGETQQWVEHTEGLVLTAPALTIPGIVARQLRVCEIDGEDDRPAMADQLTDVFQGVLLDAGLRS